MDQLAGKIVMTWVGRILCVICGLSIGGVIGDSPLPHLTDVAFVSAVLIGVIYVFILPTMTGQQDR